MLFDTYLPLGGIGCQGLSSVRNGIDGVAELARYGTDGGEMMLSSRSEGLVILGEDGVTESCSGGGKPNSSSKIRRTTLGYFLPCTGELSGLGHSDIQTGEGDQLVGGVKAMNISNLAEDDGAERLPNARDGGDIAAGLLQQDGYLRFKFFDLPLQKF